MPASTVYLTAIGRCRGVERRIDAVLRVPPFPWAIASGGRIETRNGVYVAALPEGVWPPPDDESELLPADLMANDTSNKAIILGDDSRVLGDVEAVGGVFLPSPGKVVVKGEVRSGSSAVELPTLRPDDFDPAGNGTEHFTLTEGNVEELTGTARAARSLDFSRPLKLDNAQLFVDGDLTLSGGVSGTGAIIATGDVKVLGGARVEAPTELAVISGGKVSLVGEGAERSRIRGLFFANEGLEASELTLVGTLLTGKATTGITLDKVNVFYEESGELQIGESGGTDGETAYVGKPAGGEVSLDYTTVTLSRPDYQYGFSFRIQRPNDDQEYPNTVTIGPGSVISSARSFTITRASDYGRVYDFLIAETRKSGQRVSQAVNPGLFANIKIHYDEVVAEAPKDPNPGTNVISQLSQNLSQFLPIEDRIRLVSWVEQ